LSVQAGSGRDVRLAPAVRLAVSGESPATAGKNAIRDKCLGPDVRLAVSGSSGNNPVRDISLSPEIRLAISGGGRCPDDRLVPPTIRLAHVPGAQGDNILLGQRGVPQLPEEALPALLVSFFYFQPFAAARDRWAFRDWALDSGAFSAKNSGVTIDLDAYIETCKKLKDTDPLLTEIFSLDVIGDWKASAENARKMWAAGIPAIPTFHIGEPWDALKRMAGEYPKIALGGVALARGKRKLGFLRECFARVWPKKIHGFGCSDEKMLRKLPFHSVDATNWELAACGFGNWKSYGKLSVRGSTQNLRSEVEFYLRLERELQSRWKKEMALLAKEA
jgi:hypothetical protein